MKEGNKLSLRVGWRCMTHDSATTSAPMPPFGVKSLSLWVTTPLLFTTSSREFVPLTGVSFFSSSIPLHSSTLSTTRSWYPTLVLLYAGCHCFCGMRRTSQFSFPSTPTILMLPMNSTWVQVGPPLIFVIKLFRGLPERNVEWPPDSEQMASGLT